MSDFVKISKDVLGKEWYADKYIFSVYLHCILKANLENGKQWGKEYKRGQFITKLNMLSIELGISTHDIYKALQRLASFGELKVETLGKYYRITVKDFEKYLPESEEE